MSARWPGSSRPRSASPAVIAGSTQAERIARHSDMAWDGPSGAVPGRPGRRRARDGAGDAGPRVDRLDRGVGPERDQRAGAGQGGEREGGAIRAIVPRTGAPWPTSERRCTGCTDAAIPSAANRGTSASSTSWACSTRGTSGVAPTVGASASSAARTAASPMPWICVAIPSAAADAACSRSRSGGDEPHAEAVVGRRLAGHGLHRSQQGRRARAERAVGERLEPAQPQPVERVGTQAGTRCAARPGRRRRAGRRGGWRGRAEAASRRPPGVR